MSMPSSNTKSCIHFPRLQRFDSVSWMADISSDLTYLGTTGILRLPRSSKANNSFFLFLAKLQLAITHILLSLSGANA